MTDINVKGAVFYKFSLKVEMYDGCYGCFIGINIFLSDDLMTS